MRNNPGISRRAGHAAGKRRRIRTVYSDVPITVTAMPESGYSSTGAPRRPIAAATQTAAITRGTAS